MAGGLTSCHTCGGQAAVAAAACPHRGAPRPRDVMRAQREHETQEKLERGGRIIWLVIKLGALGYLTALFVLLAVFAPGAGVPLLLLEAILLALYFGHRYDKKESAHQAARPRQL